MDMRIVHEGDAGHRVAEYVVRLRDESGHHHGVKGVDGGFEFGFGLNLHFHVNHLLARASGGNTAKLEPVIGDRCAEGQPHLIVEHEFFHNVSCTCTRAGNRHILGITTLQPWLRYGPCAHSPRIYSGNLLICTGRHSGARFFRHTTIAFEPVRVSGRDQGRLASMFMELSEPMSLMASALTRPE